MNISQRHTVEAYRTRGGGQVQSHSRTINHVSYGFVRTVHADRSVTITVVNNTLDEFSHIWES